MVQHEVDLGRRDEGGTLLGELQWRERVGQTSGFFPLQASSDAVVIGGLGQQNVGPLCKSSALAFQGGLILSSYQPENKAIGTVLSSGMPIPDASTMPCWIVGQSLLESSLRI